MIGLHHVSGQIGQRFERQRAAETFEDLIGRIGIARQPDVLAANELRHLVVRGRELSVMVCDLQMADEMSNAGVLLSA